MLDKIEAVIKISSSALHKFGILFCLPLLALIVFIDVILRYFFKAPLSWGMEANGVLLFLVFLFSISACWDAGKHIKMELLYEHFPRRIRRISDIITVITGVFVFSILGIQGIREIPYLIRTNETMQDLPLPIWPLKVVLAIVCFLFCASLIIKPFSRKP